MISAFTEQMLLHRRHRVLFAEANSDFVSTKQISLKVMIDKHENRVLFAEAGSDFVDILFSFLTMPMGTIVRILSQQSQPLTISSFNNICKSIANLESKYFVSEACREVLLNARNAAKVECQRLKIQIDKDTESTMYYFCESCFTYLSSYSGVKCTKCHKFLNKKVYLSAKSSVATTGNVQEGVFVLPTTSFVITDNLNVTPNNPTSIFGLLTSSGVSDFGALEEKIFTVGSTEIVELLKHSILSTAPLTSMFLGKNYVVSDMVQQTNNRQTSAEVDGSFKKMTVRVLVHRSSYKILFAYCSEDFIDFLFNFVTTPLGRVISMRKDYVPTRGVDNILQSISNLNVGEYFKSQEMKEMLLYPRMALFHHTSNQLFPQQQQIQKFYLTTSYTSSVIPYSYSLSTDRSSGGREMKLASPTDKGFLNSSVKFMVTDDLVVTPLSTMSCIKYLQSWEISPSDTDEQVIDIGMEEGIDLLRASLVSSSVLTNGLKHLIETKPNTKALALKKPKNEK